MNAKFLRLGLACILVLVLLGSSLPHALSAAPPNCAPTWTVVPSPQTKSVAGDLNAVVTDSTNTAWAFGGQSTYKKRMSLFEKWDGYQWSRVPPPTSELEFSTLRDGIAFAPNDVWAVGSGNGQTLTLHWNGKAWRIIPSPVFVSGGYVERLAALASNNIWAVGGMIADFWDIPTVYHWDGTTWDMVTMLGEGEESALNGITILAPNEIWVVGSFTPYFTGPSAPPTRTLIYHYDGTDWQLVPSPNADSGNNELLAVAGAASDDVWAIGSDLDTDFFKSFLLHWDGANWKTDSSSLALLDARDLRDIYAQSANDIWAVGSSGADNFHPFTIHWNGIEWSEIPTNADSINGILYAVKAVSPTDVWAVGQSYSGNQTKPLIMHYGAAIRSPLQSSPANKAVLKKSRIKLAWEPSTCASSYDVVVKTNSARGTVVDSQTSLPSPQYKTIKLARDKKYVWNVRGCNADGCGLWSGWRSFTISP